MLLSTTYDIIGAKNSYWCNRKSEKTFQRKNKIHHKYGVRLPLCYYVDSVGWKSCEVLIFFVISFLNIYHPPALYVFNISVYKHV